MECKFYMQEIDTNGTFIEGTKKDLEVDFVGLRYSKANGINKIGKPRVYTEKYAEQDGIRVFLPKSITNDSTTIDLELIFVGDKRQDVYDSFNEYVRNGVHVYWDTLRGKSFPFVVANEINTSEENFKGVPYMKATYKLTNLHGKCEKVGFIFTLENSSPMILEKNKYIQLEK